MEKTRRPHKLYGRYLQGTLTAVDWLLVNAVFALALWLLPERGFTPSQLRMLGVLINVSFIPVVVFNRPGRQDMRAIQLDRVAFRALAAVGTHALFFMALNAFLRVNALGGKQYLLYYMLLTTAVVSWSVIASMLIKRYRRKGYDFANVVIVGTNDTARRLYEEMCHDSGFGYRVLAFFSTEPVAEFCGRPCYPIWELRDFVPQHSAQQIYYTLPGRDELLPLVVKIADDNVADFFYVPLISRYISRGFELHNIGAAPVLTVMRNPLSSTLNSAIKRTFDLVFSSAFLCVYPLIYLVIGTAIKITSPGPIYFKQRRTGYRGQEFTCLKFRTMHVNSDADSEQATENDPRKTRLGDFLRRTSLDELPQFINVWRGDMSVVGPRPHMLKHTEDYSRLVDRYMLRHLVKPGITGWAQVNGYRGITDQLWKMERRVENDVWYIEHWSLLLDLKIIVRTVLNAFVGEKNAY